MRKLRSSTAIVFAGAMAVIVAACGNSTATSTTSATVPAGLSVTSFDSSFSVMSQLKGLHDAGSGLVGVVLPDTTSSTRYVNFDAPYLKQAFTAAGYSSSQYKIDNAGGDPAQELNLATADITAGAKVLVFDPLNSNVGGQIQQLAQSKGVKTISYDRATFTGTNVYYVSFDNVQVGHLIGQGFKDCITAWGVSSPKVFTLDGGEDTDPNAVSFAQGYNQVVWGDTTSPEPAGKTNSDGYTLVGDKVAPGWDNAQGQTIFQQQFTAHRNINATIEANDGLGNAVITVLKNAGVGPKKIPTTGQDATEQGMANVLKGYQCGSVYKAVYLEAQDAVALATILRAGQTPPAALLNGTTSPPPGGTGSQQPASLLTPKWVTIANMNDTVIKDKFVDKTQLCTDAGATACSAAGIS
ncbi:MAG: substrate-binding domain-containing protein [Chloroflexi bacterium]|nr:MAG: substrate-binding domain-containing protein [Chloroflexota bacterium]